MAIKYIVYRKPTYSPGDYYGIQSNTIEDIVAIFNSKSRALEYCRDIEGMMIREIIWEE